MTLREWVFDLPLQTEAELRLFVRHAFGVTIPDTQVCEHHTTPWRAFADAFFARSPVSVWKASRGFGGKSYLLSLLTVVEAAALKADVSILGGSGEQSKRVLDHMRAFWAYEAAPKQLLAGDVAREMRFAWGNRVTALMASQASVRGPHPQRLRLDEVDEMRLDILDAALGQPMSRRGIPSQVVMSSTHQYADGTMSEILRRAAADGWPVYEWCWRETSNPTDGWLTLEEVERKRAMIPVEMWRTEFDLQEPAPDNRAIDPTAVDKMFQTSLGSFGGSSGEIVRIEERVPEGRYIVAADWARKVDFTEIGVIRIDVKPARLVWFWKGRREPWPRMVARFDRVASAYGVDARRSSRNAVAAAYHDGTGLGDVVDQYMETSATPVLMVGRQRKDMFSNVIAAIEGGEIVAPMIKSLYKELKYVSVDDVYGAGHPPDGLAMLAVAWHGKADFERKRKKRTAESLSWLT